MGVDYKFRCSTHFSCLITVLWWHTRNKNRPAVPQEDIFCSLDLCSHPIIFHFPFIIASNILVWWSINKNGHSYEYLSEDQQSLIYLCFAQDQLLTTILLPCDRFIPQSSHLQKQHYNKVLQLIMRINLLWTFYVDKIKNISFY